MSSDKFTVRSFWEAKKQNMKIKMLTAYDYPTAKLFDESGIDSILVGDSLGMVVLGYEDTIKVTMEDMIHHIKPVARAAKRAMVIGDMPFLSYNVQIHEGVRNAGRLLSDGGCTAVKLEGGESIIAQVKAITAAGIPVMGHLGYTPQSINMYGGHMAQGKTRETAHKLLKDALLLQESGVFAIVLECVPYMLAEYISKRLDIPTIGIGSGKGCDGQVLVMHDMIGLFRDFMPRHAKRYADMGMEMENAVKRYINEVEEGVFPQETNAYKIAPDIIEEIKKGEM
jgi:3-methyl-2-oxobutanoate hydroxymethyltransferase